MPSNAETPAFSVHRAFIALGSNLGDRRKNLEDAVAALREMKNLQVRKVSSVYETMPVGGPPGQEAYLNAAAEIYTDLGPREVLEILLEVEGRLGRVRGERNLPRTIDLDLLLYEDAVIHEPDLDLPHPRLHQRWFVLAPLAEIAPEVVHPVLGRRLRELLAALDPGPSTGGPVPGEVEAENAGRELTGLRALVTGSTSGIGKAMVLELARGGAEVLAHGRRSQPARELTRVIQEWGGTAHIVLADLHLPEECRRLAQAAWESHGPLDIWINNAGADILTGAARRWTFDKKLQELLEVDVRATVILAREVGRRMKERGQGVILNMGWDQAETGMEGDSGQLFAAAKAAVMAFTRSLALSLAPEVRVNCLAPGWIRTAWGQSASQSWQERVVRETPLGRWGTPEDVARAARWLVSPAAGFVTGQVLRINGGAVR